LADLPTALIAKTTAEFLHTTQQVHRKAALTSRDSHQPRQPSRPEPPHKYRRPNTPTTYHKAPSNPAPDGNGYASKPPSARLQPMRPTRATARRHEDNDFTRPCPREQGSNDVPLRSDGCACGRCPRTPLELRRLIAVPHGATTRLQHEHSLHSSSGARSHHPRCGPSPPVSDFFGHCHPKINTAGEHCRHSNFTSTVVVSRAL
jgi:hypothetical protein